MAEAPVFSTVAKINKVKMDILATLRLTLLFIFRPFCICLNKVLCLMFLANKVLSNWEFIYNEKCCMIT
jgi:hypothetical protein